MLETTTVIVLVDGVYATPKGDKSSAIKARAGETIEIIGGWYADDVIAKGQVELPGAKAKANVKVEALPVVETEPEAEPAKPNTTTRRKSTR